MSFIGLLSKILRKETGEVIEKAKPASLVKSLSNKLPETETTVSKYTVPETMSVDSIRRAKGMGFSREAPDEEDLQKFMETLQKANPDLASQKSPSAFRKIQDLYEDWKTEQNSNKFIRKEERRKNLQDESIRQQFLEDQMEAERLKRMGEAQMSLLPTVSVEKTKLSAELPEGNVPTEAKKLIEDYEKEHGADVWGQNKFSDEELDAYVKSLNEPEKSSPIEGYFSDRKSTPRGIEEKVTTVSSKLADKMPVMDKGNDNIRKIANDYLSVAKITNKPPKPLVDIDKDYASKVAKAYDEMKHSPDSPEVKRAYDSLIKETLDQFKLLKDSGLKISRIEPGMENPYKNSKDLYKDIKENNHMWYYPTESGFGTESVTTNHPLLKETKILENGKPLLANDIFRIVHDYFGHVKEGTSFGPKGEEMAYRIHKSMYSPEAQRALATETRGQNSWVNFGPYGEKNRADPKNTTYAEQKAGLLPDWAMDDY